MKAKEFSELKTGTGDPITPEKLLHRCLWRLEDLKRTRDSTNMQQRAQRIWGTTPEQWRKDSELLIGEVRYCLSLNDKDEPTHYD